MIRIKQNFESIPLIEDIGKEVKDQLSKPDLMSAVKPGDSVAITAGSRGIANMDAILKAVVEKLKDLGARPFIIPAMGSHGAGLGQTGTRPGEVRKPAILQKLPGFRSEPPMSLPSAKGSMPQARATAAPPLLPPQVLVMS